MNKLCQLLVTVTICLLYGCSNGIEQSFTGSGTFEATEVLVSTQSNGEIKSIVFKEGDRVTKGQLLAEIDAENLHLQRDVTAAGLDELSWNEKAVERETAAALEAVNQAKATLANLRKTRDRIANLFEQGAATRDRLDKAETEFSVALSRLKASESRLDGLRAKQGSIKAGRETINARLRLLDYQISKSAVIAPADGVIIEKFAEQGELANVGTPICTIADLSSMWLTIYVGEEMLGKILVGSEATIHVDSHPNQTYEGRVSWISREAEFTPINVQTRESRVDLVYAVKITVDNREGIFKIGMPADAHIISE